jgi:hypothetical protein
MPCGYFNEHFSLNANWNIIHPKMTESYMDEKITKIQIGKRKPKQYKIEIRRIGNSSSNHTKVFCLISLNSNPN